MKNLFSLLLSLCLLFSCSDPCKDVDCRNGGLCDDGTCICEPGFKGTNCDTEIRAEYIGTWTGTSICAFNPNNVDLVTLSVVRSSIDPTRIIMDVNGEDICANIDQEGNMTIPEKQIFPGGDLFEVSGAGSIVDGVFDWTFNITRNGVTVDCLFSLRK